MNVVNKLYLGIMYSTPVVTERKYILTITMKVLYVLLFSLFFIINFFFVTSIVRSTK